MNKEVFLALAVILIASPAQASDRIGNGGTGIECPDGRGGTSLKILDLYTASADFHLIPDFAGVADKPF
jgi:hypothetical protein